MKINLFNAKVLGAALVAAALALGSCSEDKTAGDEGLTPPQDSVETPTEPTLYTAPLATVASSSDRVQVVPQTKADDGAKPGSLTLFATIENPSKQSDFANFESEGRYLSATSVYYDRTTGTYYATYHMQGNNYNTNQTVETAGLIETFTLDENGTPQPGNIYRSADPEKLDFDFNHLYFDDLSDYYTGGGDTSPRIIAVGHSSEPVKVGTGTNTKAIVAKLNLTDGKIEYTPVLTGEKILDENGKSLGNEDAGDVNGILRKYNNYFVATRKGVAALSAKADNLFAPIKDQDGNVYFIKTPGSAKHLCSISTYSHFALLYLTENTPSDMDASTAIEAHIARFGTIPSGWLCGSTSSDSWGINRIASDYTEKGGISAWPEQESTGVISPVDGKNVLTSCNSINYACLGKGGLYVGTANNNQIIKFSDKKDGSGSRPVNGVFIEDIESATDGFIYVANGACLSILDARTLEKVVPDFSAFEEDQEISANYVHVVKTNTYTNASSPDRIITVAYGQAGVKVFKFVPSTKF